MDASTLKLHRQLLRFLKGSVAAYGAWIEEQAAVAVVASLKKRKAHLPSEEKDELALTRKDR